MSSFITIDATQDVFELVLARPVVTPAGEHPRLVHLWWRAPMQGDRLVQVYVDEVLYDVTLNPAVREMILLLDRTRPNRIELLAVRADDAEVVWRPQPGMLNTWMPHVNSSAQVALVRDVALPADTQLVVEIDGGVADHGPMWPATETRSGPGDEDATGLGLGVGGLGAGPLGMDGTAWRWKRDGLDAGQRALNISAVDHAGRAVADAINLSVMIEQLPNPVTGFSISSGFQLAWAPPDSNP